MGGGKAGRKTQAARAALLALGLLALGLGPASPGAAAPGAPSPQAAIARLIKGPYPAKGLPFFETNALPALQGEYSLAQGSCRVWSCRAPLVFGGEWKSQGRAEAGQAALRLLSTPSSVVLALSGDGYTLFFEAPSDSPTLRTFAYAMEKRFRGFFAAAPTDAELSFPAFVDLGP